jgi:iron complex outermembrane receptor protein
MPLNGAIRQIRHRYPKIRIPNRFPVTHKRLPLIALFLGIHLLALSPLQGHAQETKPIVPEGIVSEEMALLKEEEIVSIATRYDQPISEAPSNIYVITDEDIRQSGAVDIPTILRRIPGMEVMQTTGADFNVSVRGDNQLIANKLLVMVDGRSIYIDVQGSLFWKLLPVTLPEIKRIEVLKGPASAVYGFNAFDGIINIITKPPDEMKGTTLQFGGGEFGTITSAAVYANTVGKLGYRLSIGRDQNQQWRNSDALAFRAHKLNVQTEYALTSDSKLSFSGGLVDSNRFDGPISEDTISSITPAQGYMHLVYERPNFYVRGYWNRYDNSGVASFNQILAPFLTVTNRDGTPKESTTADTYNVEAQHAIDFTSVLRLTYGANYRHNTMSSNLITGFSTENRLGFYGHAEWRMAKPLTLIAGLRYDMDTFIKPTVSPRVALLYNLAPDHTIRLSGSVAYRPPTLFEKTVDERVVTNPPLPTVTTTIAGGTEVNPEQIISYEAEYQGWYLKHRLRTRAALFYNHISDLISIRNVSPTLAAFRNDGGSADIYGAELGVEFLATKWLSGFANYSYQEINQTLTGRVRRAGPHSKFNAGLRGEWENGLSAEVTYHYYGAVTYPIGQSFETFSALGLVQVPNPTVGSYNLLNMRAGYRFWQQKAAAGYMRDAELAVSVFNALDDQHKEHPLGDTINRRVMGWLTVRF